MNHDPLCPFFYDQTGRELVRQTGNPCTYCDLISRVREDEKKHILQAAYESAPSQVRQDEVARIYNIGYTEAISNAIKAVEVLHEDNKELRKASYKDDVDTDYYWALDDSVAAIEALRVGNG